MVGILIEDLLEFFSDGRQQLGLGRYSWRVLFGLERTVVLNFVVSSSAL